MNLNRQSLVHVQSRYGYKDLRHTQVPQPIAQFAMQLIERWGMVAGQMDGEDSAGRAKMRLMTPAEIVNRAMETAAFAFEQFANADLLLEVPLGKAPEELP